MPRERIISKGKIDNGIASVGSGKRDEMVNHLISECSKLAQKKYKTRHDWMTS